jgi:hypothetical protein
VALKTYFSAELETAHVREHDVEHEEVYRLSGEDVKARGCIGGGMHSVAFVTENKG